MRLILFLLKCVVGLCAAIGFFMLAAAVGFLFFGSQATDAFVYCKLVNEVMAQPGEYAGRQLRVEGELEQGSVRFREKPCEWRFVLVNSGQQMPVRFPQCVVPDTFRDGEGLSVTVQSGAGDGSGIADSLYAAAGATIGEDAAALYGAADLVLKVDAPSDEEAGLMKEGAVLVSFL